MPLANSTFGPPAEWKCYPQHWYDIKTATSATGAIELWPPLNFEDRNTDFNRTGMRYTAVFVCLTHRWQMPHLLVVSVAGNMPQMAPDRQAQGKQLAKSLMFAIRLNPSEDVQQQLKAGLERIYTVGTAAVGELLGTLWVTSGGNYWSATPVLPIHCTRPREQVSFYQVVLGSTGSFVLPAHWTLKAIALTDLPATSPLGSLPFLVSRFSTVCFDSAPV